MAKITKARDGYKPNLKLTAANLRRISKAMADHPDIESMTYMELKKYLKENPMLWYLIHPLTAAQKCSTASQSPRLRRKGRQLR